MCTPLDGGIVQYMKGEKVCDGSWSCLVLSSTIRQAVKTSGRAYIYIYTSANDGSMSGVDGTRFGLCVYSIARMIPVRSIQGVRHKNTEVYNIVRNIDVENAYPYNRHVPPTQPKRREAGQ
jgi:hypothetical protein